MEKCERYFWGIVSVLLIGLLLAGVLQLARTDLSARQNEHRRKMGAVYMTLNNPFYEIIDEEIRSAVENNGDILLSRDPALSVKRQTEEIQELIKLMSGEGCGCGCDSCGGGCGDNECDDCGCEGGHCHK